MLPIFKLICAVITIWFAIYSVSAFFDDNISEGLGWFVLAWLFCPSDPTDGQRKEYGLI